MDRLIGQGSGGGNRTWAKGGENAPQYKVDMSPNKSIIIKGDSDEEEEFAVSHNPSSLIIPRDSDDLNKPG